MLSKFVDGAGSHATYMSMFRVKAGDELPLCDQFYHEHSSGLGRALLMCMSATQSMPMVETLSRCLGGTCPTFPEEKSRRGPSGLVPTDRVPGRWTTDRGGSQRDGPRSLETLVWGWLLVPRAHERQEQSWLA